MFKPLLAAAVLLAISACDGAAAKDGRLYCAADDPAIVTAFEIEFDNLRGGELRHFKGGMEIRDARLPKTFGQFALDSRLMTQRWSDGGMMSFRLYKYEYTDGALDALDIEAVLQQEGGDRYRGHYSLSASRTPPGRTAKQQLLSKADGALICSRKPDEETLAIHQ